MCYEVFNRSAAQTYMHALKRERRLAEGDPETPEAVIKTQRVVEETKAAVSRIDWVALSEKYVSLLKRSWKYVAALVGVLIAWMLIGFLVNPSLWYYLSGKKVVYAFSSKAPTLYLIGIKQNIKIWSERQGRLDTPMETFKTDEIGNVFLENQTGSSKKKTTIVVHPHEWIRVSKDAQGSESQSIPLNHPTLSDGRLVFGAKGELLERHYVLSPRVAKSIPFLAPRFPKESLKQGKTWNETLEWLDVYNEWKIYWSGTLHWTAGAMQDCSDGTCVHLSYTADLRPELRGWPDWASGAVKSVNTNASTQGQVLFDVKHDRLLANTFSYEGLLNIPLADLVHIPWELRIGRRVKGIPGMIEIRFQNSIDIRKN